MGTRRLLILDGDKMVLLALARLMESAYEVVPVATAEEALLRASAGERWYAALVDVSVPEIGGAEFARQVTPLCPSLEGRVVLLSAGWPSQRFEAGMVRSKLPVVLKPCTKAQVLAALAMHTG